MPASKARKRRREILRQIEQRVDERRGNWDELAATPVLERDDNLIDLHEAVARKLGHDYADLRSQRRDIYDERPKWEGKPFKGRISAVSRRAG